MATISFEPQAKGQAVRRFEYYLASGTFASNADHSGIVPLSYRGLTRVGLFVKGSGAVPASGTGILSLHGVVDDNVAGDQAFKFEASLYLPNQSTAISAGSLSTTALTNGTSVKPSCLAATGALVWALWDNLALADLRAPWHFRELVLNYAHGAATSELTFTDFGLLLSFADAS